MNLLQYESSPYLLQHAHNPVHWQPWGEAAFEKAKQENKAVLISIGYSTCHWCHVMERESFEDPEVAELMNTLFVNIKVDREEYPDIDHMYMDAVQAMSGNGGWPLNVFATPDKKPFYGGTYFPPKRAFNRASWKEILVNIAQYYSQNRDEVERQAGQLYAHLENSMRPVKSTAKFPDEERDPAEKDKKVLALILSKADTGEGGFGEAPKFPSTFAIRYLLDHYAIYGSEPALQHACLSLDKMALGGLYDQLGGGFARYSTDKYWIAPHFEKMLYDNALLLEVYAIAYLITKKEQYRAVAEQTVKWLLREMKGNDGLFYSAQDADSEGVEGKYYTWSAQELKDLLGSRYGEFASAYNVKEEGNFQHEPHVESGQNILYRTSFSSGEDMNDLKQLLLQQRLTRIKPLTDDKVLMGWNALMNRSLSMAALAFENETYSELAVAHMKALVAQFTHPEFLYTHTARNGKARIPAFSDDLAYLARAFIMLHQLQADTSYLEKAREIIEYLGEHFTVEDSPLFVYAHPEQRQVPLSKQEIYDGALPSGNSVLCEVLHYLSYVYMNEQWEKRADAMLQHTQPYHQQYPVSFGIWAASSLHRGREMQVSILGKDAGKNFKLLYTKKYKPYVSYVVSDKNEENIPEVQNKFVEGESRIFVCREKSCLSPFTSADEAMTVIL